MKATLILSNGTRLEGESFGAERSVTGTVVFSTSTIGYPESLTDPSYKGKIVVYTYPLIGNYGVPKQVLNPDGLLAYMESETIQPSAIIATNLSSQYSHWNANESLQSWLIRENITAITGIDTRYLTKILRENGIMEGKIIVGNNDFTKVPATNYVKEVSCQEIVNYENKAKKRVILVDCGVKHSQIRALLIRGVEVVRVPWDYDFNTLDADGLFISSGPDSPNNCIETINHLKTFLVKNPDKPLMSLGLGCNLLALAVGAKVSPLKYGHHGSQPIQQVGSNKCYITSQNHAHSIECVSLPQGWNAIFKNLNDNSCEGFSHDTLPWFGVTFDPETVVGANDTEYLYDNFIKSL